jgi:hypothetical protein
VSSVRHRHSQADRRQWIGFLRLAEIFEPALEPGELLAQHERLFSKAGALSTLLASGRSLQGDGEPF